ncbi:MAG: phosphotransferase family protein [Candidatus Odinarchaeia archaeon]
MSSLKVNELEEYLKTIFHTPIRITKVTEIGKLPEEVEELKGFGYGKPYLIKFNVNNEIREVVMSTMKPDIFGHQHFSDRAQALLWAHSAYNNLPKHVKSIDVGAFTKNGKLKSLGDAVEFFIVTEKVDGEEYFLDLERIRQRGEVTELDLRRAEALSTYLAQIHKVKNKNNPDLYVRRIRELIGHGECIMGLIDSYPKKLDFTSKDELKEIEKKCVEWRWKIKDKVHRLSMVHGDFHPWNILFKENTDFVLLDRSRGEWGEPADDLAGLAINYIFYSIQTQGEIKGPFKDLLQRFFNNYLEKTKDKEILEVIQPFLAWRGLVVASPIWYPNLSYDVRRKLFNLIENVLDTDVFDVTQINQYISDR